MFKIENLLSVKLLDAVKNSSWLIAEKAISIFSGLFLSIYLAKYLGVSDFGKLSFLLSIVALMSPLASLGLNSIITRELINKPKQSDSIICTSIVFRFIAGLCSVLLIVLISFVGDWFPDDDRAYLLILGLGTVFSALQVIDFWFQSKLLSKHVVKVRVFTLSIFLFLKIYSLVEYNSLGLIVVLTAIEFFFQSFVLLIPYQIISRSMKNWQFDFSYGKSIVKESYWLILSGFAAVIYLKIDQIMIGVMIDDKSVGIYSVASRFSEVWYFIPVAIVTSLFPMLLEAKKLSFEYYQNKLQNIFTFLFWLALSIAVLMQFLSQPLINLLYEAEFADAGNILSIHIWAGLFIFMRALLSKWLIAERLLKFSLLSQGSGAVLNILLNYYLIPIYGVTGAAITTLISYGVASWLILFACKDTAPIGVMMLKAVFMPFIIFFKRKKGI